MTEKTYLEADTVNGITESDWASVEGEDVLHDELFFESLKDCSDDETLYGCVSEEWRKKIEEEYGIN